MPKLQENHKKKPNASTKPNTHKVIETITANWMRSHCQQQFKPTEAFLNPQLILLPHLSEGKPNLPSNPATLKTILTCLSSSISRATSATIHLKKREICLIFRKSKKSLSVLKKCIRSFHQPLGIRYNPRVFIEVQKISWVIWVV